MSTTTTRSTTSEWSSPASSETNFAGFLGDCEQLAGNKIGKTLSLDTLEGKSTNAYDDSGDGSFVDSEASGDTSSRAEDDGHAEMACQLPIALRRSANVPASSLDVSQALESLSAILPFPLDRSMTRLEKTFPSKSQSPCPVSSPSCGADLVQNTSSMVGVVEKSGEIGDDGRTVSSSASSSSSSVGLPASHDAADEGGEESLSGSEECSDSCSSSDFSGSEDEEVYGELLAQLPIAMGSTNRANYNSPAKPTTASIALASASASASAHQRSTISPTQLVRAKPGPEKAPLPLKVAACVELVQPIATTVQSKCDSSLPTNFIDDCKGIGDDPAFDLKSSSGGCLAPDGGEYDDDDDNDDSDDFSSSESETGSGSFEEEDEDGYENLMDHLPITVGRTFQKSIEPMNPTQAINSEPSSTETLAAPFSNPATAPVHPPAEDSSASNEYIGVGAGRRSVSSRSSTRGSLSSACSSACSTNERSESESDDGEEYADLMASLPNLPLAYKLSKRSESVSSGGSVASSASNVSSTDASDSSSDCDSEYDDLMAEMPIALGSQRKGKPAQAARAPCAHAPSTPKKEYPAPPPELMNPMEGLAMFQSIRADLEKVGRLIVAKKDGEKFLQRAHILASINWLAPSIPICVLDHLGQEVRRWLDRDKKQNEREGSVVRVDFPDDASQTSALSDAECPDGDSDDDHDGKNPLTLSNDKIGLAVGRKISPFRNGERNETGTSLPYMSYFEGALLFGTLYPCWSRLF